jgi:hypothetical protein
MEINLKVAGGLMIVLALVHTIFPRYFNWANELQRISLINRQMMYVHTFFIGVMLLLMGVLCICSSAELVNTLLGRSVCLGLAIFWLLRLAVQFFVYSGQLWKGKKVETTIHVLFIFFWTYLSVSFVYVVLK